MSKIEWTDRSDWNPIRGCTRVSEGCRNCYAEGIAARFSGAGQPWHGFAEMTANGPRWTGKVELIEDRLTLPLKWRKPAKIFVNSMSDLFHESVPDEWIDRIFAVMALAPQHTFQVLTKRAKRMREYCSDQNRETSIDENLSELVGKQSHASDNLVWPLPNVWLGVTAEDQARADERLDDIVATPAARRFISYEPALGPLDLRKWMPGCYECGASCGCRLSAPPKVERCVECGEECGPETEPAYSEGCPKCHGELEFICPDCGHYMVCQHPDTPYIDWVIAGGESGPKARPTRIQWARELRDQCAAAGVAFFMKQMSGKTKAERAAIPEDLQIKEFPDAR